MTVSRIAVVGAECTGKTSLCEALAAALPAVGVTEALREFGERHARTPWADEQAALVQEQLHRERQAQAQARRHGLRWVVIDSTPLATALYSQQLFGDDSLLAAALAHQRDYALTLLTDIDCPWVADGIQRDGPGQRADFHRRLTDALSRAGIAFVGLSGDPATRLAHALASLRAATHDPIG